jgi:sugar fermentation stimulation protein A
MVDQPTVFNFSSALTKATLIKRYKRFLADVKLSDGEVVTVHCPNTGAMTDCATPGWTVYLSRSSNKKRKYAYTWEIAVNDKDEWIGINTHNANKIVKAALQNRSIVTLAEYNQIIPEFKVGESRIDFLLKGDGMPDCYIEVKSMTLCENGVGYFPDTVTQRGTKHANKLAELAQTGHKAILLFCAQHSGIETFSIAKHIDEKYALAVLEAQKSGVEVICYKCNFFSDFIELGQSIPIA